MEPSFLTLDEVLEIHEEQIERYGGSSGLRHVGGLESAVATPQAAFSGEFLHASIPAIAAAYPPYHLCQNHPFIDGNKRVGANAAITFLLINDWERSVRRFGATGQAGADRDIRSQMRAIEYWNSMKEAETWFETTFSGELLRLAHNLGCAFLLTASFWQARRSPNFYRNL